MPSGKTHIRINWFVLALINILIMPFHMDISIKNYFLFNIIFILTSYYISPDLDITSSVYRRWGLLKIIWWPYKELMKHRQMSHSIIWGPISILFYMVLLIIPIILAIFKFIPIDQINESMIDFFGIVTISVIIICEVHILADKIF